MEEQPLFNVEEVRTSPSNLEEDKSMFNYLNSPSPLEDLSCIPEDQCISTDEVYYLLGLLGIQVPNGTNVEDDSMNDSVEGGTYIHEEGQIEPNIEVSDCDYKNIISNMQSLSLMDSNPVERGNDEDLTNKQLNAPILKRKRIGQIDMGASCSTHEKEEESADLGHSNPNKKPKIHESNLTGEGGACKHCKCVKSQCLKLYCECFATGVYCTGPCSCQNCLNIPIHEDIVLEARKKIVPKVEDPNKRGCNCNKSNCQKKYCQCFKVGVGCSPSCNCQGCENIHGRKNTEAETNSHLDETEALPNSRPMLPLPYLSMENPETFRTELLGSQNQELMEPISMGDILILLRPFFLPFSMGNI